LVNRN